MFAYCSTDLQFIRNLIKLYGAHDTKNVYSHPHTTRRFFQPVAEIEFNMDVLFAE